MKRRLQPGFFFRFTRKWSLFLILLVSVIVSATYAADSLVPNGQNEPEPTTNDDGLFEANESLLGETETLRADDGDNNGDALLGDFTEDNPLGADDLFGEADESDALLGDFTEDGLLGGADESDALLEDFTEDAQSAEAKTDTANQTTTAHPDLFADDRYPSANTCKVCHPRQYEEWSVSQHAYAQLSPVYMAMQNTINAVTSGTNGDFCIRCHNQVGMNLGESTYISNLERHPTSREGITCVVCHRINQSYGKVSGRMALVEGGLTSAVYGPQGNAELQRVLSDDSYRVVTDPEAKGRKIHAEARHFPDLSTSGFCGSCHDVNLFNGFRLEEAFSEYKNSPAAKNGVSCQDCHMGKIQGLPSGYNQGPAAMVGGVPTVDRKATNHFFAGPDYSLVHPGIFPHNDEAARLASLAEWLEFDYDAGWGTDAFEDTLQDDHPFPERWESIDDRYEARGILSYQFKRLEWARDKRLEVLRNGYVLGQVATEENWRGLKISVEVENGIDGHNVPTGFIAERLVWLFVEVQDKNGSTIFQSGDLDPNGDVRDSHSLYVHNGDLPLDKQLFTLQSRFLTRNVRGGEREQVLAVNFSIDPLPFIRPSTRSTVLTGQPAGARIHRYGIPPNGVRTASYRVPAKTLKGNAAYRVTVQLKAAMVPVNLIDAIKGVGFDFNMSARQIADRVVAGHEVLWEKTLVIGANPRDGRND